MRVFDDADRHEGVRPIASPLRPASAHRAPSRKNRRVGTDNHLIRETMNAVEARLSPDAFVRIHRCHIVNIEQVRELQPWFNGEYVVFLKNGTRLTLSRGYRERLQDRVGRAI